MNLFQVALLAIIQGAAELLPVSSSAHVIVAEKLMGLDPGAPEMTFLLVMLHTGTMFAVLIYFWNRWKKIFSDPRSGGAFLRSVVWATACTGVLGFGLKKLIEHGSHGEVEDLFRNLPLMAGALFGVGILILVSDRFSPKNNLDPAITSKHSLLIGAVQGLCLPFRGFSRSGATISTALLAGITRARAEDFSFALAVVLTPPVIFLELHRLLKNTSPGSVSYSELLLPGAIGMVLSFGAGLGALKLLSAWLENGRWKYFGYYCLAASAGVAALSVL